MSTIGGPTISSINYTLYLNADISSSYPGMGTTWYDLSDNHRVGTMMSGATFNNESIKSLNFTGSTARVMITTIQLGTGTTPWTVSSWIKTTNSNNGLGYGSILTNSSGGPVYGQICINSGYICFWGYLSSWYQRIGTKVINDDVWHYLTWVQNSNYLMDMYVDGVIDVSGTNTQVGQNPVDIIGNSWVIQPLGGKMGLLSIHGKSLTSNDVLNYYNSQKKRYGK